MYRFERRGRGGDCDGTARVRRIMPNVAAADLAEMEHKFPCGTEDIVRGLGQVFEARAV